MQVEHAYFLRGIPTSALEQMEVWEVAGQLGAAEPDAGTPGVEVADPLAFVAEGFDKTLLE